MKCAVLGTSCIVLLSYYSRIYAPIFTGSSSSSTDIKFTQVAIYVTIIEIEIKIVVVWQNRKLRDLFLGKLLMIFNNAGHSGER